MINRKRILIQKYNAPFHRAVPTQLKPETTGNGVEILPHSA
jgi:hypothetical protein